MQLKYLFYTLWLLISLILGALALLAVTRTFSFDSGLLLLGVAFYAYCFFRLIRSFYPDEDLLTKSEVGFWLCWIILPLAVCFAKNGLDVIMTGNYYSPPHGRGSWITALMNFLGDAFGAWLPGLITMGLGIAICFSCVVGVRRLGSKAWSRKS